ncbi:putative integral membrane protein (TIGR02327 family) [Cytobacillus kochii]|nr:putative integral membrane protein (TIGR02327 family) [Cytobacillus kochii]
MIEGVGHVISGFGQQALVSIIVHLIFIAVAWYALQAIKIDTWIKANHVLQARVLYVLLSIALGSIVGNFVLDYLLWSQQLPFILQ